MILSSHIDGFDTLLQKYLALSQDTETPLRIIGEQLRNSVTDNFKEGGRPKKWKKSKKSKENLEKYGDAPLINRGVLLRSFDVEVEKDRVSVFTDDIRAATLNFGDPKRNIAERMFMLIQNEDEKVFNGIVKAWLLGEL